MTALLSFFRGPPKYQMPPKFAPFDDVNAETFSPNHFVYDNSNEEEEENEAPEPAMVRALYEVADGGIGGSHQTTLLELGMKRSILLLGLRSCRSKALAVASTPTTNGQN
jgi:hypothetical protein